MTCGSPCTTTCPATRVHQTVENRTGSAGSRWNRSGPVHEPVRPGTRTSPVHEPVRFPLTNRAYIFLTPANRSVSPVYRPVFLNRGNRSDGGLGNPARDPTRVFLVGDSACGNICHHFAGGGGKGGRRRRH
jgi:hypothetical protein